MDSTFINGEFLRARALLDKAIKQISISNLSESERTTIYLMITGYFLGIVCARQRNSIPEMADMKLSEIGQGIMDEVLAGLDKEAGRLLN